MENTEEIKADGQMGVKVMTKLLTGIYTSAYVPDDLLKSILVSLSKKSGAIECENHRRFSLMSLVTKM